SISQYAAVAAFEGDHSFLEGWRTAYRRRRNMVVSAINAIPGLFCATPQGAFYVYPSCADFIGKTLHGKAIRSDLDFAEGLLEVEGVAVVPGVAFGLSPHFRISYATSDELLAEACKRLSRYCSDS
ncbi:MAG: aminotransferase class I/II-fold pyridoxal phosphate-dependent enzyme, partial [Pseudomonadota bacterium]